MSEIAKYLRLMLQADKEAKITVVDVTKTPTKFTSQLTGGNTRRKIAVHNRHAAGSGECYYSFSDTASPSGDSVTIPKDGHPDFIPIGDTDNIEVYFFCEEGQTGSVQVIELS